MSTQSIVFLTGAQVVLRPLLKEDLSDTYIQWLNDNEVCKGNRHGTIPYTREMMDDFYAQVARERATRVTLSILDKTTNAFIGVVSISDINWMVRCGEFSILIGDKAKWNGGIGEETVRLIFDYAFRILNLNRISAGTFHTNNGMQHVFSKIKMQKEGVRRRAAYKNGEYLDIVEFGILKEEFYT